VPHHPLRTLEDPVDRLAALEAFLQAHGCGNAARRVLAADASFRTYYRLTLPDGASRVLMDAPPPMEDVRPFLKIAALLHDAGLSAPEILASDAAAGFVLLEDLGDSTFTRVLQAFPEREKALYRLAVDALLLLHRTKLLETARASVPHYDSPLLLKELRLFPDWTPEHGLKDVNAWLARWQAQLAFLHSGPKVLVLRDYHVDNLMELAERPGAAACGLLDFQDAVLGHPAYDLVSLLWDARRDVSPALERSMLQHYLEHSEVQDKADFMKAYYTLGVQRTLKIIGIFHRLHQRDGKKQYLQHLPRLYQLLEKEKSITSIP
jgi:N-acetylmuramate 1-kinase